MSKPKKMPRSFPAHLRQFLQNIEEVELLFAIHQKHGGTGPGRKRDVEVLNKSALVFIIACWEAFIEDLADSALKFMIEEAHDPSAFPVNVLESVAQKNQGVKAWSLAGDGWKQVLRDNYVAVVAKTTGKLNTPRAENVDELFLKVIGLSHLSSHWHWKGRTQPQAVAALDAAITLRGQIAHRVQHSESVQKRSVHAVGTLVNYLAARSSNAVRNHVHARVGKYPWMQVTFRKVA